jgi:hypothetical protein
MERQTHVCIACTLLSLCHTSITMLHLCHPRDRCVIASYLQVVGGLVKQWSGQEPLMHWSFPKQDAVAFLLPNTAAAITA